MTRTCHPASAMLPPELAPIRVGLLMRISGSVFVGKMVSFFIGCEVYNYIPEADSQVTRIHAVLCIVFLDLVEVL